MPWLAPQPINGRWCDIEGARLALFCRVEQVAQSTQHEALPSRLHQHGQVVGRGLDSPYVCFADNAVVSLPPTSCACFPTTTASADAPIPAHRAQEPIRRRQPPRYPGQAQHYPPGH